MKQNNIVIVDYGLGNIFSVARALEICGASNVSISASAEDIANADSVILPGVGAFGDGMRGLSERSLIEPLIQHAVNGKPLLGICLGMQMLASSSEEFGSHKGLGLIPGNVRKIPNENIYGLLRKTPFIGWASLERPDGSSWSNSVLRSIESGDSVYLVHSYYLELEDRSDLLATYSNYGEQITAAVRRGNVTGLQFHPEKSGKVGLQILREFILSANSENSDG